MDKNCRNKNSFIIVLAINDIIGCGFLLPIQIYFMTVEEMLPSILFCKIYTSFLFMFISANGMILILVVIDQTVYITKPRDTYKKWFRRRNCVIITFAVYATILGSSVSSFLKNQKIYQFILLYLDCVNLKTTSSSTNFFISVGVMSFITAAAYIRIIIFLRYSRKNVNSMNRLGINYTIHLRYFILVTFSILLQYGPSVVSYYVIGYDFNYWYLYPWTRVIQLSMGAVHPLIFVWKMPAYIIAFKAFMRCKSPRQLRKEMRKKQVLRFAVVELKEIQHGCRTDKMTPRNIKKIKLPIDIEQRTGNTSGNERELGENNDVERRNNSDLKKNNNEVNVGGKTTNMEKDAGKTDNMVKDVGKTNNVETDNVVKHSRQINDIVKDTRNTDNLVNDERKTNGLRKDAEKTNDMGIDEGNANYEVNDEGKTNDMVNDEGKTNDMVNDEGNANYEINDEGKTNDVVKDEGNANCKVNDEGKTNDKVNDEGNANYEINDEGKTNGVMKDEGNANYEVNDEGKTNDMANDEGNANYEVNDEGKTNDMVNDEGNANYEINDEGKTNDVVKDEGNANYEVNDEGKTNDMVSDEENANYEVNDEGKTKNDVVKDEENANYEVKDE
ncbi:unnamed protein product [Owenia fusiformis]|uniref:G-protein coupled receptors family 1 profile domain-containing protein n=1 Tax=Owenia fusiformis TaxID=6347 RepID=A0A8S4PNN2_OWEFU|nr:unnamed protein product [Owenia fusiformis]